MSRIASVFSRKEHKALIAFVTVGYPSVEATLKVVPLLSRAGCDIVELGIPFSDPLADGATIQKASYRALQNGITLKTCMNVAAELSGTARIPLVFMGYYNTMLNYGLEELCESCHESNVDGLIIPDLPPEEGGELAGFLRCKSLDLIYMLTPASNQARIKLVAEKSTGFIYLVSVTGVTGARTNLPNELEGFVSRVKQVASQPVCVGFGISTAEQAKRVAGTADGVIVGSRIIQLMEEDSSMQKVSGFVSELRKALDERE
ncbi:tryptophan synthase subunit alpha [Chloroflexota bacterium]